MGNVERCDKTLPLNQMMFHVRRDARLRERWLTDFEALAGEFGLSRAESDAVQAKDPRRLMDLGVHQYYVPQILRLFVGAAQTRPADWIDEWPAMQTYRLPGEPRLGRFLVNESARRALALAHLAGQMQFDDGISVPTHYLNPDASFRLVPVTMNCTVPPIPRPERAYWVGIVLREVIRAYPAPLRVAVVATGGLSHEPGGPRYFWVDEDFDRWFLDLLKLGDHERLLRECTLERMEAAGSGGTAELLAWIVALAFTRGPADVLAYMPAVAWRSGTGMVAWTELAA